MKSLCGLTLSAFASFATAQQGDFGTKADLVSNQSANSAVGAWDIIQMIVALGIVFALLKWALPKIVARMNKRLGGSSSETIKLEESAMFGGCQLQIVSVRGRTLLLGATQTGVSCLADLTNQQAAPEDPAFFELVDQATGEEVMSEADRVALERLSRLSI